jgi:hypothetical protein
MEYRVNEQADLEFPVGDGRDSFSPKKVTKAMEETNNYIRRLHDFFEEKADTNLFRIIDKKATSGMLGEAFISVFEERSEELTNNPSSTGHPDMVPQEYIENPELLPENNNWDQFQLGGVEVKSTCGNLKSGMAQQMDIGESRIDNLSGIEWKGHHTNINHLLALYWDYVEGVPTLCAAFYSNDLTPDDFNMTRSRADGGNTTNVAPTNAGGRNKILQNWIAIADKNEYIDFFRQSKFGIENLEESETMEESLEQF